MDPFTMALLAGGMSFGQDYLAGRSQKKQRKRYGRRLGRALNATESIQGKGLQQQEALTRQATQQQLAGYDAAKREAARLGRGAKQSALDRETQLGARASQGLADRGLGSTTIGANLQRGIASDTNRSLAGIDEGLAGMYGDLALGRAGAEAGGTQQLAGLAREQGDLMASLAQMRQMRDLYGSSPWGGSQALPGREHGLGQSLLTGAQTGLGAFMGMGSGGGGMGGGMGGNSLGSMGMGGGMGGLDPQMREYLFGGSSGQMSMSPFNWMQSSPWGYGGMGR